MFLLIVTIIVDRHRRSTTILVDSSSKLVTEHWQNIRGLRNRLGLAHPHPQHLGNVFAEAANRGRSNQRCTSTMVVDLLSDVETRDSILDHPRLVDAGTASQIPFCPSISVCR